MDNPILLYIDNCQPALNAILEVVADNQHNLTYAVESWVKNFAAVELHRAGDREQAKLLRRELNTLGTNDNPQYWDNVARHYQTQHNERKDTR